MTDKEKVEALKKHLRITWKELAANLGLNSAQTFTDIRNGRHGISTNVANQIFEKYPKISRNWVLFGEGPMLEENAASEGDIPVYEAFGNAISLNNKISTINAGSLFVGATLAVRIFSDSMTEYPAGAIVVCKSLAEEAILIPGTNYLFETENGAFLKRMQNSDIPGNIALYSTNEATYPNGKLINEPFDLPKAAIKKVYEVMGYIMVYKA